MKNIVNEVDKNNVATSQVEYKLIRGNAIYDDWGKDFYSRNKNVKEIKNLNPAFCFSRILY